MSLFLGRTLTFCAVLALGCGGETVEAPDTDGFDLSDEERAAIDEAASKDSAQGSYSFDETAGTLTITLSSSTFECGPTEGVIVADVVVLTPEQMVWEFDDGGSVTWSRIDSGDGLVGVWMTDEPLLYLIIESDGTLSIVGDADCDDDDRPRNDRQCVELGLFGASIEIDGSLEDWDAIGGSATVSDDAGDSSGADPGADIKAMKVEVEGDGLFVLMELFAAPSESFQGRGGANGGVYRAHVEDSAGNSIVERIAFNPELGQWQTAGDSPAVTAAVGSTGIEWRFATSAFSSDDISIVRVEAVDCGQQGQPCQRLDEIDDCGFLRLP